MGWQHRERSVHVGTKDDARPAVQETGARGGWLRSAAMIVVFDVAAPLVAYNVLRSAGMTAVSALILSGVFPALGVGIAAAATRRLDVVGVVVLAGIVVGTILGLISHSARAVLVEGSVPTGIFGVACLGSLWARLSDRSCPAGGHGVQHVDWNGPGQLEGHALPVRRRLVGLDGCLRRTPTEEGGTHGRRRQAR